MRGPIAVGGLGGSGTRLVAHMLQSLGVYIGASLNTTLDNLWFTLLVDSPALKMRRDDISERLSIFEKAMTEGLRGETTQGEEQIIARSYAKHGGDINYIQVLELRESVSSGSEWWGFKNPGASFFIEDIARHFPQAHFIHVVRNGQDMCYSETMRKVFKGWHEFYGVESGDPDEDDLLRFWVRANREAIATGKRLLGDRFHVFSFEDVCHHPAKYVEKVARIIGESPSPERVAEICEPIHVPDTIGRGRVSGPTGLRLNLGCCDNHLEGFSNVDRVEPADVVTDLEKDWPWLTSTVEMILALDIFEHLPDKIHTMNEAYRVLQHGGVLQLLVPTTDGRGAFQDPTHCSFWTPNDLLYYTEGKPEHDRFARHYGISARFNVVSSRHFELAQKVWYLEAVLEAIK